MLMDEAKFGDPVGDADDQIVSQEIQKIESRIATARRYGIRHS